MIPTAFDGDNIVLERVLEEGQYGKNTEDIAGTAISALQAEGKEGNPCLVLCYKMTEEELKEINKTGRVWLIVHGLRFPMVELRGEKPF